MREADGEHLSEARVDAHDAEYLSEADAARLWQRAAALQAEATRRDETPENEEKEESTDLARRDGYALEHVRAAAVEAGIGAEYLDAALADLRVERAIPSAGPSRLLFRRLLRDPPQAIEVRRVVSASVAKTLATMEEVVPNEPYRLNLTERQGDPLQGGLLVFNIEGASFVATEGFAGQASAADMRQVYVSVRPLGDDAERCEITVRGPVAWAYGINVAVGTVFVGVTGALGFGVGWGLGGVAAAAIVAGGVVSAPIATLIGTGVAIGGLLGGTGGGVKGFRAIYDYSLNKGRQGLESLLSAIAVRAQGGWGITGGEGVSGSAPPPQERP